MRVRTARRAAAVELITPALDYRLWELPEVKLPARKLTERVAKRLAAAGKHLAAAWERLLLEPPVQRAAPALPAVKVLPAKAAARLEQRLHRQPPQAPARALARAAAEAAAVAAEHRVLQEPVELPEANLLTGTSCRRC